MKKVVLTVLSVITLTCANSLLSTAAAQQTAPAVSKNMPYGVEDVLKLARAQVSEDVIVKYVQSSGIAYNLSPEVIVQLRNEGVSDRVLNAMIVQGKSAPVASNSNGPAGSTGYWTSQQPVPPPAQAQTQTPQVAPIYNQPPQPEPPPPPPVRVIRYYPAVYAAPYYGPFSGWYGPSVSLGFGFSFGHHHYGHHHH